MNERLVWILGSSRSGSTWLLRMLAEIDGVAPIDDPHLGHHLGVWRPIPLAWAASRSEPELATLIDLQRSRDEFFFNDRYADAWEPALRDLILARFRAQLADQRPAADTLMVKEPASQVADLLSRLFPEAGMIFLLRDPRDVVASWLDAYRPDSWAEPNGSFPVAHEGRVALASWLASVWLYRTNAVTRAITHHPGATATVRYEDLRADPAAELRRVCDGVGLDCAATTAEAAARRHDFDRVARWRRGRGKAIRHAKPGAWRQELRADELDAVIDATGAKLVELGYAKPDELATGFQRVA